MSFTSTYPTNLVKLCYGRRVLLISVSDAAKALERAPRAASKQLREAPKALERVSRAAAKRLCDLSKAPEWALRGTIKRLADLSKALERVPRALAKRLWEGAFGDYGYRITSFPALALRDTARALERASKAAAKHLADLSKALEQLVARGVPGVNVADAVRALERISKSVAAWLREGAFWDYGYRVAAIPVLALRDVVFGGQWPVARRAVMRRVVDAARALEPALTLRFRVLGVYLRTVSKFDVVLAADHNALRQALLNAVEKLKAIRAKLGS